MNVKEAILNKIVAGMDAKEVTFNPTGTVMTSTNAEAAIKEAYAAAGGSYELLINKSTNVVTDAASDTKYPSVKAVKTYADGLVVGLLDDRGGYDPTGTSAYPASGGSGTIGAILKGDLWFISVDGTIGGIAVKAGYSVRALVDTPAQVAGNWNILNVGLGCTPENITNKVTAFQATPDGTHYASEKLIKDNLDRIDLYSGNGIVNGFTITINADTTKIDISSGVAYHVDNTTVPGTPVVTKIAYAGATAIILTNIGTAKVTYLAIDKSGVIQQKTSPYTTIERRDYVLLGATIHSNLTVVNAINNLPDVCVDSHSQLNDLFDGLKNFNISGNVFSPNGANLKLNKSEGVIFKRGVGFLTSNKNPHTKTLVELTAPATIRYRQADGTEQVDRDTIDLYWDNAGTRTAMSGTKWYIQRINVFSSNLVRIQYGQAVYDSLSEAYQGITSEVFTTETNIAENGLMRCFLIVKGNIGDFSETAKFRFIEADKFGSIGGGAGSANTSLQQAYNNSETPEIVTDAIRGAVTLKEGVGVATNKVIEVLNNIDQTVFSVDGYGLVSAPNRIGDYATQATASGTTTLTVASKRKQYFTGILNQILAMPDTTTLTLGQSWEVTNDSTGIVTINTSNGTLIFKLNPLETCIVTCILASGTTAASWGAETTELKQNVNVGISIRTPVTVSIDYTTRVLTLTGTLGYFDFFVDGSGITKKYTKVGAVDFTAFTDDNGEWFFYFDNTGTAITTQVPWAVSDFPAIVPVYILTWNKTKGTDPEKAITEYVEAHTNSISADEHAYEHLGGSIWQEGLVNAHTTVTGTPNVSGVNTCVGMTSGTCRDDNLPWTITNSVVVGEFKQDLGETVAANITVSNGALMEIRYKTSASLADILPATRFPFDWDTGTNRPNYITSGGVRTAVPDNSWFVYYAYSINDKRNGKQVRLVSETTTYSTLALARASNWSNIQSNDVLFTNTEIRPLYKYIFYVNHSGGGSYNAAVKYTALREVTDYRKTIISLTANAGGSLPASSITTVAYGNQKETNAQSSIDKMSDRSIGYETTATAAGTATLLETSKRYQYFTGVLTQTVVLPVTSTLFYGRTFEFVNKSTGIVTVNSSEGNAVVLIPAGATCTVKCIGIAATTAADWDTENGITVKSSQDASLGSELITTTADRDFSSDSGHWTGIGWTVGSSVYTHVAGANVATLTGYSAVALSTYQVSITVNTTSSGSLIVGFGGGSSVTLGQTVQSYAYSLLITAANTNGLILTPDATWAGTVDSISVKLITPFTVVQTIKNTAGTISTEIRSISSTCFSMGNNANKFAHTLTANSVIFGQDAFSKNISGDSSVVIGSGACFNSVTATQLISIGSAAFYNLLDGVGSIAIGRSSGRFTAGAVLLNQISNYCVYLGMNTKAKADNQTNEIVIGYDVTGNGSNTVTIGNSSVTATYLPGQLISTGTYAATSANLPNAFIDTDGKLYRATTAVGNMVLATSQAVTGLKTFDKEMIAMKGTSTGRNLISVVNTSATSYTNTIPAKSGTFAMLDDLGSEVDGSTDATVLTVPNVFNTIINNYGQADSDVHLHLPTAAAGMNFVAVVGTTRAGRTWKLQADTNDKIYLDGVAGTDNQSAIVTPLIGNYITFFTFRTGASAWDWMAISGNGIWTAGA